MAAAPVRPAGRMPRLLKSSYLGDRESLLEETRATGLFYFPGPVFALFILFILDYGAASIRYKSLPAVPGLTAFFAMGPDIMGRGPETYYFYGFIILTLIALLWLLVRFIRWTVTVYAITTHRVIVQRGIIGKEFDEIPIQQVRGVDVKQRAVQRMLGYGTVRVSSEGGTSIGNEDWHGIPKPFRFQKLIENATQQLAANVGTPTPDSGGRR